MSNKVFKIFFLILSLNFHLLSAEVKTCLEVRSAAFFHSSSRFREIYGNASGSYQVEALVNFDNSFDTWMNFDWFSKHGRSEGFNDPTKVRIANLSLGIQFPYQINNCFSVYAGIGPSFSIIWLKNRSKCTCENISKFALGGILKTGAYYFINRHIFFDIFVDYLYQPVHFESTIDIGGFKTGIGVGYQF